MREILFRGKRINTHHVWDEGSLLKCDEKSLIYYSNELVWAIFEVVPETVGQYTGLTDKNGVKIFEDDIVSFADCRGTQHKGVVYWCSGSYDVDCSKFDNESDDDEDKDSFRLFTAYVYGAEIIGNIHDNPELLKGEQK